MPPVVIAAGIAAAGTVAGAIISKSASDNQAEAAKEAAKAGSDTTQKTEEIVHRLPVESGAATASGYQLEAEFQAALAASLKAGNESGINWG